LASALAGRALAGGNAVAIIGRDPSKARVSAFVESLGMRPMDAGELPMARALENVTLLHLGLVAHSLKHTSFALGVLS
jgi:8-hydroxy-5-deazaflavin:NADPH oxidoreductase